MTDIEQVDFDPIIDRRAKDFETPYPSIWDKVKYSLQRAIADPIEIVPIVDLHPRYQPVVDFPGLKNEQFAAVVIKLTQAKWTITNAVEYCLRAQDAELDVMVYHWFQDNVSGVGQAEYHLNELTKLAARLGYNPPTWADVERAYQNSIATRRIRLHEYLLVTGSYRKRSGFYSSPSLWLSLIGNIGWVKDFDAWLAHWTSGAYVLPVGWVKAMIKLWQKGVSGAHSWIPPVPAVPYIPGVQSGNVDYNLWQGTRETLKQYIGSDTPEPPDPPGKKLVKVTASGLNMREGPSSSHSKTGLLLRDTVVSVTEENGPWLKVKEVETESWIHGGYTEEVK